MNRPELSPTTPVRRAMAARTKGAAVVVATAATLIGGSVAGSCTVPADTLPRPLPTTSTTVVGW